MKKIFLVIALFVVVIALAFWTAKPSEDPRNRCTSFSTKCVELCVRHESAHGKIKNISEYTIEVLVYQEFKNGGYIHRGKVELFPGEERPIYVPLRPILFIKDEDGNLLDIIRLSF